VGRALGEAELMPVTDAPRIVTARLEYPDSYTF
jgi:hypothetical protein